MDKLSLVLEPRTVTGKKVKHLRAAGLVPASICGRGVTPENYVTDARIFGRVYQAAGRSTLIELQTPTGVKSAFIREIQRHPISTVWLHVDFRVVDLRVAISADVPVVLVGENIRVERGEALPNQMLVAVHVRALPGDLPQNIEIDISKLVNFDTTIHVSDLDLGDKVEILTPPEEAIATLSRSTMATEEEELVEEEAAEAELAAEGEAEAAPAEEGEESTEESGEASTEE